MHVLHKVWNTTLTGEHYTVLCPLRVHITEKSSSWSKLIVVQVALTYYRLFSMLMLSCLIWTTTCRSLPCSTAHTSHHRFCSHTQHCWLTTLYCRRFTVNVIWWCEEEKSEWEKQRHKWVRSGRTREEAEASYCSSETGREGRGELIRGCKNRKQYKEKLQRRNEQ